MLIKYIVPEDGDEQTHPNVFSVVSVQAPSLGQVRKAFPLPGTYHFRMLRTVNNMTVWMDAVDDSMALSAFEGTIFLKASRVGENSLRQQQQLAPSSSATANVTGQQSQQRSSSSGSSGSGPAPSRSNLLQFSGDDNDHHHGSSSASASFLETDTNDLIGLNSPEPVSSSSSSSSLPKPSSGSSLDLFGIDSLQPTVAARPAHPGMVMPNVGVLPQGAGTGMRPPPSMGMNGMMGQQQQQQPRGHPVMGAGGMMNNTAPMGMMGMPAAAQGGGGMQFDAFSGMRPAPMQPPPNQQPNQRRF